MNIFEEIENKGTDKGFRPTISEGFEPTDAAPGSKEKIAVIQQRLVDGHPIWHDQDRNDFSGLNGEDVTPSTSRVSHSHLSPVRG